MKQNRRVVFSLDEGSFESLEKLRSQGRADGQEYEEITLIDKDGRPQTLMASKLPTPKSAECRRCSRPLVTPGERHIQRCIECNRALWQEAFANLEREPPR